MKKDSLINLLSDQHRDLRTLQIVAGTLAVAVLLIISAVSAGLWQGCGVQCGGSSSVLSKDVVVYGERVRIQMLACALSGFFFFFFSFLNQPLHYTFAPPTFS